MLTYSSIRQKKRFVNVIVRSLNLWEMIQFWFFGVKFNSVLSLDRKMETIFTLLPQFTECQTIQFLDTGTAEVRQTEYTSLFFSCLMLQCVGQSYFVTAGVNWSAPLTFVSEWKYRKFTVYFTFILQRLLFSH